MKFFCVFCLLAQLVFAVYEKYDRGNAVVQWTGGEFFWPCPTTKNIYKNAGKYIRKNAIATRAQIRDDIAYVITPRLRPGVPATLSVTSLKCKNCQTLLEPFPSWSMQEEGNCKAIQNAIDIFLDADDILWVLDVGIVNAIDHPVRKCRPKVLAFNTRNGNLVHNIDLGDLICESSRLQYLVVNYDSEGRCFIYVSDAATCAILVYDVSAGKGFRLVLPEAVTKGCTRRDVLYLSLIHKPSGDALYFTYLSSNRIFSIKTQHIQSGSTSGKVQDVGIKPQRMVILGTDNGPCIFFRYEGSGDVYQWDSNSNFGRGNFKLVYRSPDGLLPTHALADYKRGRMRVLESNFLDFIHGTVGCGVLQRLAVMNGLS